jgi:predicted DNA-binding ribbon-helix-helix protein
MVSHMKTTINLSDPLFQKASRIARQEKTTFRALVEEGLRRVLEDRQRSTAFRLSDVSYGSGGLRPEVEQAGWDRVRDLIYEGRGA